MHHFLTKYINEYDDLIVESWLQINLFKWSFCFSKRRIKIKKPSEDD